MTQMMRAAVVHEFRKPLTIDRLPIPAPGPGQVLVRMEASGVCHTDLHAADGDWPVKPTPPFVPGHEGVGRVVALGSGVTRSRRSASGSASPGWAAPAAPVSSACRAGRRSASASRTRLHGQRLL